MSFKSAPLKEKFRREAPGRDRKAIHRIDWAMNRAGVGVNELVESPQPVDHKADLEEIRQKMHAYYENGGEEPADSEADAKAEKRAEEKAAHEKVAELEADVFGRGDIGAEDRFGKVSAAETAADDDADEREKLAALEREVFD
jgi:hypothetical protein